MLADGWIPVTGGGWLKIEASGGAKAQSTTKPPRRTTLHPMKRLVTLLLFLVNAVLSSFLRLPVELEARDLAHFAAASVGGLALALVTGVSVVSLGGLLVLLPGVLSVAYRQVHPNPSETAVKELATAPVGTTVTLPAVSPAPPVEVLVDTPVDSPAIPPATSPQG